MYPKWMTKLLFYFDLWGYQSEFRTNSNQQKFDGFVLTLHIILASIFSVSIFTYLRNFSADILGTFNDTLKLYSILFVYWLTIVESFIQRDSQRKFWDIVARIDQQFCSHQNVCFKFYACKMALVYIISILLHAYYAIRIFIVNQHVLYLFWTCYTAVVFFYTNRFFYYLFYMEFIKHQLQTIDQEIGEILLAHKINRLYVYSKISRIRNFHEDRFKWIRAYFGSVHDICTNTNSVFGWANVATILLPFLIFLTDINWFYWKVFNKYRTDPFGEATDFVSQRLTIIFLLKSNSLAIQSTHCCSHAWWRLSFFYSKQHPNATAW